MATLEGPGYGLVVARCYCGSFMTALDMAVGPVTMTTSPDPNPRPSHDDPNPRTQPWEP